MYGCVNICMYCYHLWSRRPKATTGGRQTDTPCGESLDIVYLVSIRYKGKGVMQGREKERKEKKVRKRRQRLPLQKKNRERKRKRGDVRSACLSGKWDWEWAELVS